MIERTNKFETDSDEISQLQALILKILASAEFDPLCKNEMRDLDRLQHKLLSLNSIEDNRINLQFLINDLEGFVDSKIKAPLRKGITALRTKVAAWIK